METTLKAPSKEALDLATAALQLVTTVAAPMAALLASRWATRKPPRRPPGATRRGRTSAAQR